MYFIFILLTYYFTLGGYSLTFSVVIFCYLEIKQFLPVVGRRVGPGRSAGRSHSDFSTEADRFAPLLDSPAPCCRAGWDSLLPELCLTGPADSTGKKYIKKKQLTKKPSMSTSTLQD